MSNTPPTVLQLARQGDPEAIAALMNRHLEAQGITAHVVQHDSTLQVNLEAAQIPNQADLVAYVKKGVAGLELATVQQLTVSGKQLGADTSAWSENLVLQDSPVGDFDFDLGLAPTPASDDLDLGFDLDRTSGADLDFDQLGDFDASLGDDFGGADLDLGFTDSSSDLDLNAPTDFDLSLTDDSAGGFGLDLTDTSLSASSTNVGATDDFGLEFTDTSADASALDFDLGLGEEPSEAEATDLDFDLEFSEPAATESAADFDLDLALTDTPAADLSFAEDSASTVPNDTELDFDLDLEEAPTNATNNLGLDLDFMDAPAVDTSASDFDLDLGMDDLAMGGEVAEASADDLDLNLGPDPSPTAGADTDLDFDLDDEDPITTDALDLDLGLNDDDLDLDLDLGPDPSPIAGADTDLDFDLDDEEPITTDALDLDLGLNDDDLDLDLGPDPSPTVGADTGLDFDLDSEDPVTTDALDLDLGLNDALTGAGDELDFDLGTSTSDLDLDFAAADQAALDLEAQQRGATSGTEEMADFDLDFESSPDLSETVGDQAAIAADDLDFDLNTPAAPPTAPDIDLDDLWSSSDANPDLGITAAAGPADTTATPWANDLSGMDDLVDFDDDLSDDDLSDDLGSEAVLADDLTNLEDIPSDLDFSGIEPDPLTATEFDAGLDLGLDAGFEAEAQMAEESTPDAYAFPDLDLGSDSADSNLEAGLEPLPPDLLTSEEVVFEDLGAAAVLDLTEPAAFAGSDWAAEEPDLTVDADADLGTYGDLGTYNDLGTYDDLGTADLAEGDLNDAAIDTPFSNDFDLEADSKDLVLEPFGMDAFTPEEGDLGFSQADTLPWAAEDNSFDPNLVLDSPADFEAEPESAFDPDLSFDSQAEDPYTTPNPFAAESYGAGFETDADLPFSTMELDQTVGGDVMPDFAMSNDLSDVDAAFLEQPEDYSTGAIPSAGLGLSDDIVGDPAVEPVEFGHDEFEPSGFEPAGLSDTGFETDFGTEGFADEGFGNASFDDEGFDDEAFSDSALDSNGFIQDRNGVALTDDEPDATDDFIQEFGSDPSTHVALTPDQFNDDGSVRQAGGGSSLPMRLILGLVGALALGGLLLYGMGRLRQPTPGGDPAITEPAVTPPVDPAAVPEEDLFRQAVNAAQTAANQAQTATTPAQWQAVADAWAQAIALMQQVPASDPNYATAQQKAVDYQPNLNYARQNAQ